MASFADVVKRQRKEGSSRTGALASAVGQKTLEAIDPRKFFDQSGILTSLFPSLKAYKARGAGDKDVGDKSLNKLATLQASGDAATRVTLEEMVVKLDSNLVYSRMIAKNSTVLPQMARDANLTKQNIGSGLFTPLTGAIGGLITSITSFASDLKALLGITSSMGILRAAIAALTSPLALLVAPVAALAAWLIGNDKKGENYVDENGQLPGGVTPEQSMQQAPNIDEFNNRIGGKPMGLPQAMKETQAEQAIEAGRKADVTGSYGAVERIRAERSLNPTSPTKVDSSEISEDLVNFIKSKEGFTPKAKWDYKQWSVGYGTKREEVAKSQKSVIDHALKHGYNWDQKKIDALTSFAYNLGPAALSQLTANGTRSDEEIAKKLLEYNKVRKGTELVEERGLTARRTQEFAMFAGTTQQAPTLAATQPTMGSKVATASSSVAEGRMQLSTSPAPSVNYVNNSKNVQQTAPSSTTALNAYDPFMFESLVSRQA